MRNEKRTDAVKGAGIWKAAHSDGDAATVAWTISTSITQYDGGGLQRNHVRLHSYVRRKPRLAVLANTGLRKEPSTYKYPYWDQGEALPVL